MWEDPIVAEIHRIREKLAAESNFDVKVFFAGLRERQAASGATLVSPRKQPTQSPQVARKGDAAHFVK